MAAVCAGAGFASDDFGASTLGFASAAAPAAGFAAAAAITMGFPTFIIKSSGGGAVSLIAAILETPVKPDISTSMVQSPGPRFGNTNIPPSSVEVTIFWSPRVAVTLAPGMGKPPTFTLPRCSVANMVPVDSKPLISRQVVITILRDTVFS